MVDSDTAGLLTTAPFIVCANCPAAAAASVAAAPAHETRDCGPNGAQCVTVTVCHSAYHACRWWDMAEDAVRSGYERIEGAVHGAQQA